MIIDGYNVNNLGAKELSINIQNVSVTNTSQWVQETLNPYISDSTTGFKAVEAKLIISGASRTEILKKISIMLSKLLSVSTIKFDEFEHNFLLVLADEGVTEKTIDPCTYIKTFNLCGLEFGDKETLNIENKVVATIDYKGTAKTPLSMKITPSSSENLTIVLNKNTLKINNVTAGKEINIDSINEEILENNINKYSDTDLWQFPFLQYGYNSINFSQNVKCNFEYNERFL